MPSRGTLTPLVSTGASVLYLTRWGNKTQSFLCLFLGVYYYFCSFFLFIYYYLFYFFWLCHLQLWSTGPSFYRVWNRSES